MTSYAIHPDKCVIKMFMFRENGSSALQSYHDNRKLFEYLINMPCKTLVLNPHTKRYIQSCFDRSISRNERKNALGKLDAIKAVTIKQNIDKALFDKNLTETLKFFEEYVEKNAMYSNVNDIRMVCPEYKEVIVEAAFNNAEKPLIIEPEKEDAMMLASVITSKVEKKKNYLLSTDGHFSRPNIREAIEKRFGISPGYPSDIFSTIRPR
jgi:hypothetical protein